MGRPKEFSREKTLAKAMELFRKQGYHATTIDDLVQELGVNRASLYETYGGKREVFAEALDMYTQGACLRMRDFLDAQKGVKEGIRNLFLASLRDMKSGRVSVGCLVLNTTIEWLPLDKEVKPCLLGHQKRIQGFYVDDDGRGVPALERTWRRCFPGRAGSSWRPTTWMRHPIPPRGCCQNTRNSST